MTGPRYIDTWQAAEELAAATMRRLGFSDARLTGRGADGGVDVASRQAIAQVKFRAAQVGRPDIQRLVGARGTRTQLRMLFFSSAGYAGPAIDYANEMGVALYIYDPVGHVTTANRVASQLIASATASGDSEAASESAGPPNRWGVPLTFGLIAWATIWLVTIPQREGDNIPELNGILYLAWLAAATCTVWFVAAVVRTVRDGRRRKRSGQDAPTTP